MENLKILETVHLLLQAKDQTIRIPSIGISIRQKYVNSITIRKKLDDLTWEKFFIVGEKYKTLSDVAVFPFSVNDDDSDLLIMMSNVNRTTITPQCACVFLHR